MTEEQKVGEKRPGRKWKELSPDEQKQAKMLLMVGGALILILLCWYAFGRSAVRDAIDARYPAQQQMVPVDEEVIADAQLVPEVDEPMRYYYANGTEIYYDNGSLKNPAPVSGNMTVRVDFG